jgi:hypothetical protein
MLTPYDYIAIAFFLLFMPSFGPIFRRYRGEENSEPREKKLVDDIRTNDNKMLIIKRNTEEWDVTTW